MHKKLTQIYKKLEQDHNSIFIIIVYVVRHAAHMFISSIFCVDKKRRNQILCRSFENLSQVQPTAVWAAHACRVPNGVQHRQIYRRTCNSFDNVRACSWSCSLPHVKLWCKITFLHREELKFIVFQGVYALKYGVGVFYWHVKFVSK